MARDARRSIVQTGTILVVDDDDNMREVMRAILQENGYTVLAAAGPREALRISQEHRGKIDLLLTDVVMPEMDGLELAQSFTGLRADAKVAFVSGRPVDGLRPTEGSAGNGRLLLKPFGYDDLTGHVRAALDGVWSNSQAE
jgi:two-component system cell cycle sensor histidine kinase/response regulator CckA